MLNKCFKVAVSFLILSLALATVPAVAQSPAPLICDLNGDGKCDGVDVQIMGLAMQTANAPQPTIEPTVAASTVTPQPSATNANTPVPATATSTATARPSATSTSTPRPTATATMMPMPTIAPTSSAACLNCVPASQIVAVPVPEPNVRGLTCPAWAHDQWLVLAPNGRMYRTWHPAVQPDNLPGAGCKFNHEHGTRDPRGSKADPTLPAYGYVADLHGMSEPHEGFKTEYANAGERNEFENFSATSDVKATMHQGTFGAGRVNQRMHTIEFDLKNANGAEVHVHGMGDTGYASNQCVPPDQLDTEQGTVGVRFFALPFAQAKACGLGTPYEVWEWALPLRGDNRIHSKLGTFDAITAFNPLAGKLEQTSDTWPNAPFSGCKRDFYFGPVYLNTAVDYVDEFGVRQFVKPGSVKNFPLDSVGKSAFKLDYSNCANEPYANN